MRKLVAEAELGHAIRIESSGTSAHHVGELAELRRVFRGRDQAASRTAQGRQRAGDVAQLVTWQRPAFLGAGEALVDVRTQRTQRRSPARVQELPRLARELESFEDGLLVRGEHAGLCCKNFACGSGSAVIRKLRHDPRPFEPFQRLLRD